MVGRPRGGPRPPPRLRGTLAPSPTDTTLTPSEPEPARGRAAGRQGVPLSPSEVVGPRRRPEPCLPVSLGSRSRGGGEAGGRRSRSPGPGGCETPPGRPGAAGPALRTREGQAGERGAPGREPGGLRSGVRVLRAGSPEADVARVRESRGDRHPPYPLARSSGRCCQTCCAWIWGAGAGPGAPEPRNPAGGAQWRGRRGCDKAARGSTGWGSVGSWRLASGGRRPRAPRTPAGSGKAARGPGRPAARPEPAGEGAQPSCRRALPVPPLVCRLRSLAGLGGRGCEMGTQAVLSEPFRPRPGPGTQRAGPARCWGCGVRGQPGPQLIGSEDRGAGPPGRPAWPGPASRSRSRGRACPWGRLPPGRAAGSGLRWRPAEGGALPPTPGRGRAHPPPPCPPLRLLRGRGARLMPGTPGGSPVPLPAAEVVRFRLPFPSAHSGPTPCAVHRRERACASTVRVSTGAGVRGCRSCTCVFCGPVCRHETAPCVRGAGQVSASLGWQCAVGPRVPQGRPLSGSNGSEAPTPSLERSLNPSHALGTPHPATLPLRCPGAELVFWVNTGTRDMWVPTCAHWHGGAPSTRLRAQSPAPRLVGIWGQRPCEGLRGGGSCLQESRGRAPPAVSQEGGPEAVKAQKVLHGGKSRAKGLWQVSVQV